MSDKVQWKRITERLATIAKMDPTIEAVTVKRAEEVIRALIAGGMPVPFIYPNDGYIRLEWDGHDSLTLDVHAVRP